MSPKADIERLFRHTGAPRTIVRHARGAYDPATGSAAATASTQRAVSMVMMGRRSGRRDETTVGREEREALVPGSAQVQPGDVVVDGLDRWDVIEVAPREVGGEVVARRLVLRRGGP